ncbi:MAG: YggT family protein [Thermodesulfovibrionales bacterium]
MFIFGNLLNAVATVLDVALTLYMWIIIIAAVISWVNPDPYNPIVRVLYSATDPVLRRIRKVVGVGFGVDFSPMIAILGILFLKYFIIASLRDIAFRLR